MYTRVTHGVMGLALALGVMACGGDDGSGGSSSGGGSCVPGTMSTAGMPGDPCPQTGTQCAGVGGRAETMCKQDGTWDLMGCTCFTGPATCGNGMVDPGEECDGTNLGGQSCTSLGMGTGILQCNTAMCTYDNSMCSNPSNMTGGGGAGGV
jgi:hypothetical protein